jgi:hypothetical protein
MVDLSADDLRFIASLVVQKGDKIRAFRRQRE